MDGRDALLDEDDAESANRDEPPRSGIQSEENDPVARSAATDRSDAGVRLLTPAVALHRCLCAFCEPVFTRPRPVAAGRE